MDRISKGILFAFTAAAIGALTYTEVFAQDIPCGEFLPMKKNIEERLHQFEVGGGMVNENVLMVVFASEDGEMWTLLSVGSDGSACVISAGSDWFPGALPKKGEPA